MVTEDDGNTVVAFPHVPTVQVVNYCREPNGRFIIRPGAQYARLEPNGLLGMIVNFNAPDAVIIAELKRH